MCVHIDNDEKRTEKTHDAADGFSPIAEKRPNSLSLLTRRCVCVPVCVTPAEDGQCN